MTPSSAIAAIETFALEKTYRVGFWHSKKKLALKPLTIRVEEGEVFGFLGPNGAGKTTTLRLLMGLVYPTGGRARILGRELDDPEMKRQIGFLPEQPYFYDHLTARELLDYYARLSGVVGRERKKRIEEVLARVGLSDSAGTQLRKFSKGMLQRVGIAQAMVHDPKLLFLDEPMSGLDPIGRREVRDLIEELNVAGKTIFFSTHILSDAESLCDRVAVLNRGELRGMSAVADIVREIGGSVELMWSGASAIPAISALGGQCHATADVVRAVLPERQLDSAIDALRKTNAHLIQVVPVRATLEDYFLAKLAERPEGVEVRA
ncbi:MAG TPA: ABC transporter ATP-binding protein [candidate division Zixibacteria bacterium]|nr:ABC transporter ATP-binding protein [candidate division Zixibacteria bacterium]